MGDTYDQRCCKEKTCALFEELLGLAGIYDDTGTHRFHTEDRDRAEHRSPRVPGEEMTSHILVFIP